MPSTTWKDVEAAPPEKEGGRGAETAVSLAEHGAPRGGEESRQGVGVQEWSDGSRYEGEFMNGLKHGKGKYTWRNGEYYEGSFYKDYRHGDGRYCWPSGHKFIGKFYLNRREGYGRQVFSDGAVFQGLYHADQRFGPGVVSYPDGRQDVGVWLGERLLRLCSVVGEGFSLRNFPEYAAFMNTTTVTDCLTQPTIVSSNLQTKSRTHTEVCSDKDLPSDESFIYPPGIESYSTDGDHLPLPSGRRRELDQHFYGDLWEPDVCPHPGYERDPLSTLPLRARMQTHIHNHRLQAERVGWDIAAVLSLNRKGFGPKGPLEVRSEQLIHHASRGELRAVSRILQTCSVHPDVADSQGHTALIAATINCHNDVIHLLLDLGADVDQVNCEGLSALAVSHVLYYPFHSLHTNLIEPSAKTQDSVSRSSSVCRSSPQISQVDLNINTSGLDNRPQTTNTVLSNQVNQNQLYDQTEKDQTENVSHHSSKESDDSELIAERWTGLNEPETLDDSEQQPGEERREDDKEIESEGEFLEGEESGYREDEGEDKEEGSKTVDECDQTWESESEVKGEDEVDESRTEDVEQKEEVEEGVRCVDEEVKERRSVERSIEVLDGHISLGSVRWTEHRTKPDKDKEREQRFGSARSVSSYNIHVTEEVMHRSAEALSRTGIPQRCDTQETVRKMAAMKIEHRVRLNTLKLLLERGADPNESTVPMPILFLAVMAADSEAVKRLLLSGARTDIQLPPERKGLYPLHIAAALPGSAGPTITELLLHAVTDPDVQACDQDEIYEPDRNFFKAHGPVIIDESSSLKEGGRTALHVACQRDSDYQNASKIVALLLSHRANTDLLWSGHSPLSLAIASGNDLAVEELLKGGAYPNIRLGHGVGSALCALANINYHLGGNRTKLLDMLAKAGANIMMPVMVGDVVGTAVDYGHYSFNQDTRISSTLFHTLSVRERETLKSRRQLLSMMGDLLRHTAAQKEAEREQLILTGADDDSTDSVMRKLVFKFCYHCGRSVSVKLTACSRCHKVFYCSRNCKLKAWDGGHKEECIRVPASAPGVQKKTVFKLQKSPKPSTANKWKPETVPKHRRTAEEMSKQINMKENYSCN